MSCSRSRSAFSLSKSRVNIPRSFDLVELIEDELLLALPLVPRHEMCTQPLESAADPVAFDERVNPFDVLGELKLKRKTVPN